MFLEPTPKEEEVRHHVSKMAVDKSLFPFLLLRKNKSYLKVPSSAAKIISKSVDMLGKDIYGK
jgi:hypothetical protein